MSVTTLTRAFERDRLKDGADRLAVVTAVSLPWSTSATGILVALWLIVLIPTLDWRALRQVVVTPTGGLPVLLVLLGAAGMLWADVIWAERWDGLVSFLKLLVIPLLLVQFQKSDRGLWVLGAYALSCLVLLLLSSVFWLWPSVEFLKAADTAVPVKNAATQSGEFVTCIFGFLFLAVDSFERRRWPRLLGLTAAVLGMLFNILFVATGRTALAIIPVLLVLFAARKLNRNGILIVMASAILIGAIGWTSSLYLRERTLAIWTDIQGYKAVDERNSTGERLEFWKKSIDIVREAPAIGHGTGSIYSEFLASTIGQSGMSGYATSNPHNQTFAVAIQLGIVGGIVLWAMWIAHLLLFRGGGLAEWVGLVIVVQNIVGSLFNSHLFDFLQGWVYVIGVGVCGGMALKRRLASTPAQKPADAGA